ncbi:hypothetical protein G4B88_007998 [Cannabis sativa]|uniref:Uncharacterized protein n=1 Tax=Cannabis sativa TaxID=3483 RepID=A0A7J6I6W8_CANSA|nr:hypothetical protein G4B88_007998 [Cannabis sativa]
MTMTISLSEKMAGRYGFSSSSSSQATMKVTTTPSPDLALTNLAYVCPSDLQNFAVPSSKLFLALIGNSFVDAVLSANHLRKRFIYQVCNSSVDVERHAIDFMEAAKKLQFHLIGLQREDEPSRAETLRKVIA